MEKICIIQDCNNSTHAKGYCNKHYSRIIRRDNPPETMEFHSMAGTGIYKIWSGMKTRCYNTNERCYKSYGGRGIKVCDRWLNSFTAFFEDMGERPFKGAQLDRIDNDGNYEPGNCRWISLTENIRNRGWNKLSMIKAEKIRALNKSKIYTNKKIAEIFGITEKTVYGVLNNNVWSNSK